MKDIITCFKLIRYGKRSRMNIVIGVIFIALGIIAYPLSLLDSGYMSFYPAFLLTEGAVFLTQPTMSLAQKGFLAAAPLRRTAELYYQPLSIFLSATVWNIYYTLIGAAFTGLDPECVSVVVFTMLMNVMMAFVFTGSVSITKMNLGSYVGLIIVMAIILIGGQETARAYVQGFIDSKRSVFAAGGICEAGCVLAGLASLGLCRALYKRNYSKMTQQMLEMNS